MSAPAAAPAAAAALSGGSATTEAAAAGATPQLGIEGKVYGLVKRGGREAVAAAAPRDGAAGTSLGPTDDMVQRRLKALARQAEAGSASIGGLRAAKTAQAILGIGKNPVGGAAAICK